MAKKHQWKPGKIYPLPAVPVSCGSATDGYDVFTVASTGTLCANPPLCYISARPERYPYEIIKSNGGFVINLTARDLSYATDWCGAKSRRDYNKFAEKGLTPGRAYVANAPIVEESPVSIECRVRDIMSLGSHDKLGKKICSFGRSVKKE